jgi:hypothetical protein
MEGEGSLWMFVLFKGFIGFVVPIAFGIQQLISVKRAIRKDREAEAAAAAEAATAVDAAPVEVAPAHRPRELEPA